MILSREGEGSHLVSGRELFLLALALRGHQGIINPDEQRFTETIDLLANRTKRFIDSVPHGVSLPKSFTDIRACILVDYERSRERINSAQEKIEETEVITVSGNQLSGKDALRPLFAKYGYHLVTYSDMVRNIATVYGMDRNGTQDKIDAGIRFKEMFGKDILAQIGIVLAVEQGHRKLAFFGPRVVEEVVPGKLIVVVVDPDDKEKDRVIRLERATRRAAKDPSRAGDIDAFFSREEQEYERLQAISRLPGAIVITNDKSEADFLSKTERVLFG